MTLTFHFQEGKGVAIKSTTQFFTWLRENSDEEDK